MRVPWTFGGLENFHCMLCCLVSGSSWCIQVSSPVTMHFTNKFHFNCINFKFSLDVSRRQSFIFWSSIRGTHRTQTLVINKIRARSSLLDQCFYPLCRLSDAHWLNEFAEQQFPQHDSLKPGQDVRQDDGHLDQASSSRLFLPRRNSAAQRFTVAYDGASSPYTTVIRLCICCGETFSSVKNSITAR